MDRAKDIEIFIKVIEDAFAQTTSPRQRLAIYKYVDQLSEHHTENLRIDSRVRRNQTKS